MDQENFESLSNYEFNFDKGDTYSYEAAVKADILLYLKENKYGSISDNEQESLREKLELSDTVTGNCSGSYFCNSWKAARALVGNWDKMRDAVEELSGEMDYSPETMDVYVRIHTLYQVLDDAINTWNTIIE